MILAKHKFWINGNRQKGNNVVIYFRILISGVKAEINTKIQLEKKYWDEKNEMIKASKDDADVLNTKLYKIKKSYDEAIQFFFNERIDDYSPNDIKNQMLGLYGNENISNFKKKNKVETFQQLTDEMIQSMKDGRQHQPKSILRYETLQRGYLTAI